MYCGRNRYQEISINTRQTFGVMVHTCGNTAKVLHIRVESDYPEGGVKRTLTPLCDDCVGEAMANIDPLGFDMIVDLPSSTAT